jgi:hypothetical protein
MIFAQGTFLNLGYIYPVGIMLLSDLGKSGLAMGCGF